VRELSELVRGLGEQGRAREAAARELLETLQQKGQRPLRNLGLPSDGISDLVQQLLFLIVTRPEKFEDKQWGYAIRSLQNLGLTRLRSERTQAGRHQALTDAGSGELAAPVRFDAVEVAERWKLLDLAHQHALGERKREIDRGPLVRSWEQIKELADGKIEFRALVASEQVSGSDAGAVLKAQNRLHKAHERCRTALRDAIDALFKRGIFKEEDRDLALRQHRGLPRVNTAPKSAHSQPTGVRAGPRRDLQG